MCTHVYVRVCVVTCVSSRVYWDPLVGESHKVWEYNVHTLSSEPLHSTGQAPVSSLTYDSVLSPVTRKETGSIGTTHLSRVLNRETRVTLSLPETGVRLR